MPKNKCSAAHKKRCERYRAEGRQDKNKKKRLRKHTAKFPNDLVAAGHRLLK